MRTIWIWLSSWVIKILTIKTYFPSFRGSLSSVHTSPKTRYASHPLNPLEPERNFVVKFEAIAVQQGSKTRLLCMRKPVQDSQQGQPTPFLAIWTSEEVKWFKGVNWIQEAGQWAFSEIAEAEVSFTIPILSSTPPIQTPEFHAHRVATRRSVVLYFHPWRRLNPCDVLS